MGRKFAAGRKAYGECQRSGHKMLLKDMTFDGYIPGLRVDPAYFEPRHPLERLPEVHDPIVLSHPAPENSTDSRTVTVKFPLYVLSTDETVGRIDLTGTVHDPATDTIKAALYDSVPDISTYTTTDEVTGAGYTAGGEELSFTQETVSGEVQTTAADTVWSNASFTAQSVVIYNTSQANAVIAVLPFGATVTTTNSFTIDWAEPLFKDRD